MSFLTQKIFETYMKIQARHFWGISKCFNIHRSGIRIFIMFENFAKSKIWRRVTCLFNVVGSINPDHFNFNSPCQIKIGNLLNRNDRPRNTHSLNEVINLGIPHVGELIFESIDTPELFQCALVSETWKILTESVLIKRWKNFP